MSYLPLNYVLFENGKKMSSVLTDQRSNTNKLPNSVLDSYREVPPDSKISALRRLVIYRNVSGRKCATYKMKVTLNDLPKHKE